MAKNTGRGYYNPFIATGGSYANPRRGITDFSIAGTAFAAQMAPVLKEKKDKEEEIETKYQAGKVAAEQLYGGDALGSLTDINLFEDVGTMEANPLALQKFQEDLKLKKSQFAAANALGDTATMNKILDENATFKLGMTGANAVLKAVNNLELNYSTGASSQYLTSGDGGPEHHDVKISDFVKFNNEKPNEVEFVSKDDDKGGKQVGVWMKNYEIELREGEKAPEGETAYEKNGKMYYKKDKFIDFSRYSDANYLNTRFKLETNISEDIKVATDASDPYKTATGTNIKLETHTKIINSTDPEFNTAVEGEIIDSSGTFKTITVQSSTYSDADLNAVHQTSRDIAINLHGDKSNRYDAFVQMGISNYSPGDNTDLDSTLGIKNMSEIDLNAAAKNWHNINGLEWTGSNEDITKYKDAHLIQPREHGYVEGEKNYHDDTSKENLIYKQVMLASSGYGKINAREMNDLIATMEGIEMLDPKKEWLAANSSRTDEDYNAYVNGKIVELQDYFLIDFYTEKVKSSSKLYSMGPNGRGVPTGTSISTSIKPGTKPSGTDITWKGFTGNAAYIKKRQNAAEAMRIIELAWKKRDFNSIAGGLNIVPLGDGRYQAQKKNGDNVGMPWDVKNDNHLHRVYELSNKGLQTDAEITAGVDFEPIFTDKTTFQQHFDALTDATFTGTETQVVNSLKEYFKDYPAVIETLNEADVLSNYKIKIEVDGETVPFNTNKPSKAEIEAFKASLKSIVNKSGETPLPNVETPLPNVEKTI